MIILHDWGCSLHDLGSRTHTWVNGQQITDADLNDGDSVQIGRFQFKYEAPAGAKTAPRRAPAAEIDVSTLTDPLPLTKRVFQIGRRAGSDLEFDDNAVSNIHAILFERNGRHYVRDVGSRTGTWLDGKPIHQEELPDGAKLKIGRAIISFRETVAETIPETISETPARTAAPSLAVPSPSSLASSTLRVPPMPVPPAFVKPAVPPQISKEEPLELDLDLLAPADEAELTDEQIAAELAGESPVIAGAGSGAAADADAKADALELSPLAEESLETESPPAADAVSDDDDDALVALRRGWHGTSRVEEPAAAGEQDLADELAEAPRVEKPIFEPLTLEPEPIVDETDDAPLPLEAIETPEPTNIEGRRSPEIAADEESIERVSPEIGEIRVDARAIESGAIESPALESPAFESPALKSLDLEPLDLDTPDLAVPGELLPIELEADEVPAVPTDAVLAPVDDVSDDDGAIDLDEAPPAPVAESLAEPELLLEDDAAGLAPTPPLTSSLASSVAPALQEPILPSPATVIDEVESLDDSAMDVQEGESPVVLAGEVADDAEDDFALTDEPVAASTESPTVEEAAEAIVAPPARVAERPVADEPVAEETKPAALEAPIEEIAEAVIEEPVIQEPATPEPENAEASLPEPLLADLDIPDPVLSDELPEERAEAPETIEDALDDLEQDRDDVSEETLKSAARQEALAELELIDELPATIEDGADDGATLDLDDEPVAPLAAEPEAVDEPAAVDLSKMDFGVTAEAAEPDLADADAEREADAVAESDAANTETIGAEAADEGEPVPVHELDVIDFSKLSLDEPRPVQDDETDFDRLNLDDDDTSAEPLINLADSVVGADSVIDVEIVEETQPTLTSAMPESLTDDSERAEILLDELGVLDDSLDGLPEGDGGELVEASGDRPATPPAPVSEQLPSDPAGPGFGSDSDAADELDELLRPSPPGSLRDLIPDHGPLVGGAFMPQPQHFMVGGSPIVEITPDAPAGPGDRTPHIPPTAPPPAPNDRRKPMRVGFNGSAPAASSPFAGESRTIADVLIGRRAAQSVDVFANPSPTPEDLLLDETAKPKPEAEAGADHADQPAAEHTGGLVAPGGDLALTSDEETELQRTADRFRPRGEIQALGSFPQANIPPVYKPEEDPVYVAQLRRGRLRRILSCTLLMLPLIGAVVWGVYQFVPNYSKIEATLSFTGLDRQSEDKARQFKAVQNDAIQEESTRKNAVSLLAGSISDGFLADIATVNQTLIREPTERWPRNQPSAMKLILLSQEKEADRARLKAFAEAMIKANRDSIERAQALRDGAAADEASRQALEVQKKAVEAEIQSLVALGETRPDAAAMDAVEARRQAAEAELKSVRASRMDTDAAILALEKQPLAELAPSPESDLSNADKDLNTLNAQLAELQKQNETLKASAKAKSDAARKELDTVINEFQTELDSAKKLKDSPQLVQFVEAANRFFSETRKMTNDLIGRQEVQHTRFSELKQRLSDQIETKTREVLEKDEKLKNMNDELGMLLRQQSAALATPGEEEEAKKATLRIKLLRLLITERQESFTKDPVYVETIAALQGIIDQTAKAIQEDRKHVDAMLTKTQEEFARNSPAVEQLPADQKALAAGIQKQMAAIAEARKAYTVTADAAEAEQAKQEAAMKEKIDGVQMEVYTRRQLVLAAAREQQAIQAEANRKKKLEEKKVELASLVTKEKVAQTALDSVVSEKEKMAEHQRKVRSTEEVYQEKLSRKESLERDIRTARNNFEDKRAQISQLVVPESKFELESYDLPDKRPLMASIGGGAIFVLMLIPIIWNLRLISRDHHHHPAKPEASPAAFAVMTAKPDEPHGGPNGAPLNGVAEHHADAPEEVAATR